GNDKIRFIGLDTGYVDHSLNPEQVGWLDAQLRDGPGRTFLLTHHQLFSAYEDVPDDLATRTEAFRSAGKITGWFWGHEHLCVIYGPHGNVLGRCVGNSCFPYDPPTEAKDPTIPVRFLDNRRQEGQPSHGMHTFAWIMVDGATMHIKYIDQD